ncbi:pancreatic triacylglycerol lipase-like [Maniola jurtina]|uniref:pancreatic triacylglycerol lipase-like n=1 Tax=Maniola jurtina TaxID=191418 RepID=UPI001E689783|nr:pancreatic triacylglycerol lipase-like [Maniola jurtina]
MKAVLCVLLSVAVYTATAGPLDIGEGKYSRFIEYPDGEGVFRMVDLKAEPNTELVNQIERNPADNEYYLFTRRNPTSPQRLTSNATSVLMSNFNPNSPTVVSVHGWMGNLDAANNIAIRDAILDNDNCNVIIMDWSKLASADYSTVVAGVPAVGRGLGQFLNFLGSVTGITLDSIHLIGFSLGAHVVGNAGKQLNGRVARITGLDPAGPLWDWNPNRLHSSDAVYVEGIHTDAGPNGIGIGFLTTVGDVDFYPNGGAAQPGCSTSQCNHQRAWEKFAASVTYNHLTGRRCSGTSEIVSDTCSGDVLSMGNADLTKQVTPGLYRVNTGSEYPF